MVQNKIGILLFILAILISSKVFSQQIITLSGRVDSIADVNIKVLNTNYGTTTNNEGLYSIDLFFNKTPIYLFFSKIGFKDTIVEIKVNSKVLDSIYLNISLKKTSYLLNEVNIIDFSDFYRFNDGVITDIEFSKSELIVLILKNGESELVILNENGVLLSRKKLGNKYQSIYIDCFKNVEVIGKDSCLQIYYDRTDTSMSFISLFPASLFYKKLKPCLMEIKCRYLFENKFAVESNTSVTEFHNKRIDYYYINICDSNNKTFLNSFYDKEAYSVAASYYSQIISTYNRTTPENENIIRSGTWDGNILKLINGNHELFNLISWYLKVESKPIKVEVFRKKNEVLFFNLSNQTILKYNQNFELLDTLTINNLNNKTDIEDVIQDTKTETIYAKSIKNGIYYLGKINTVTGVVSVMLQANKEPFPKLFKVSDKFCYSVYYYEKSRLSAIVRKKLIK